MSSSMSPNGRLMRTPYWANIVLGVLLSLQGIDGFWTTSISTPPPPSSFHHRLIGGGGAAGAGTGAGTGTATRTELRIHQFNGGYDASKAQIVTWNPLQAAEFVIWQHIGTDPKEAGRQLTPLIQDWTGTEVGEFLMRLYLGEKKETNNNNNDNDNTNTNTNNNDRNDLKLSFESKHVRTPQWKGLEDEGLIALLDLLGAALPDRVLEPAEIARFAKSFLLKEHTWPNITAGDGDGDGGRSNTDLQKDTFASMGHTANLAKLFGCLRMERFGDFTAKDVLEMVLLPEQNSNHPHESESGSGFLQMHDFFQYIGIRLAPSEKVDIVQGMAQGGWGPANIAKFVSNIDEIPESHRVRRTIKIPTTRSPASDRATRLSRSETEGAADNNDDKPKEIPTPFYLGATYAYLSANKVEANGNPQSSPFS